MGSPSSRRSAWALLVGGVGVAIGSQFAWTDSFLRWISYAPLLNGPYRGPVIIGSGPGRGAHLLLGYDSGHFRVVLVTCGVLLVALAASLLSRTSNRRPLASLSLLLALGTAVYVLYELLEAWRYVTGWPILASPSALNSGAWVTTIGSLVAVAGAAVIVRAEFKRTKPLPATEAIPVAATP